MSKAGRLARLTVRGLWNFLVGDTPEFALAAGGLVAFAVLLHRAGAAVVVGLPALVIVVLAIGVWHGRRNAAQGLSSTATNASSGSPVSTSEQAQPVPSTSERSSRSERNSQENQAEANWR